MLGHRLSDEQVATLATVATSRRQVDLLIGPAGAGKTTAMRALHAAWTKVHGRDSVVGLAPSAAAAAVLAEDLDIACDNTAKWLHEHDHGRATIRRGQLVIIDEATLAGTLTLDRLTALAAEAGAKVLLVGDWAQLQSVDAGGAFATPRLRPRRHARARRGPPVHPRVGEGRLARSPQSAAPRSIGTYLRHQRVREGTTERDDRRRLPAWRADIRAGRAACWSPSRPQP